MTTGRTGIATVMLSVALCGAACEGKRPQVAVENEQHNSAPDLVSVVRMNDPSAGGQLLSGFYAIENNAWRWTAGKFSVVLRTPPGAAQNGATLTLAFGIPDAVIEKLRNITITASVNSSPFTPAKYNKPGPQVYTVMIPAAMLARDSVNIDFTLDKSVPPGVDKRELGVIATSVGLGSN
jgi:hypothetical protein